MPASIDNFSAVVSNQFGRLAQVLFLNDAGTGWVHVGRTKDVQITMEPVESSRDSAGRILTLCFDISGQFHLQQVSSTELENISALAAPDPTNHPNGHVICFTNKPYDVSGLTVASNFPQEGAANIEGFGFVNVLPQVGAEVMFGGDESFIPVSFSGRVFREAFDTFSTLPTIVFDL